MVQAVIYVLFQYMYDMVPISLFLCDILCVFLVLKLIYLYQNINFSQLKHGSTKRFMSLACGMDNLFSFSSLVQN